MRGEEVGKQGADGVSDRRREDGGGGGIKEHESINTFFTFVLRIRTVSHVST